MSCEYKNRIFFTAEIFDKDIALEDSRFVMTSSLSQALDKIPPIAMVSSVDFVTVQDDYLKLIDRS